MSNLQQRHAGDLPSHIRELTDRDLDAVAGASFSLTEMAAAGVQRAARRVSEAKGEGKCPPNHNGVRY